ncbi:MAG: hypothetical protein R3B90_21040 [Planctomycetaceae bacterium]
MARTTAVEESVDDPLLSAGSLQNELLSMLDAAGRRSAPRPARTDEPDDATQKPRDQSVDSRMDALLRNAASPKSAAKAPNTEQAVDPNTCPKCSATIDWSRTNWCTGCGYYPALGHEGTVEEQQEEFDLATLKLTDLCPAWAIALLGGVVFIFVGNGLLEKYLDDNVGWLSLASLVQMSLGVILMMASHIGAYLSCVRTEPNISLKDFLTNPPAIWFPIFKQLPEKAYLLKNATWGLTAAISAFLIFGPIHMEAIQEEIAKNRTKKPKKSAMATVIGSVAQATSAASGQQTGPAPESIDEALEAFAGTATEAVGITDAVNSDAGLEAVGHAIDPTADGDDEQRQNTNGSTTEGTEGGGNFGDESPAQRDAQGDGEGGDTGSSDTAGGTSTSGTGKRNQQSATGAAIVRTQPKTTTAGAKTLDGPIFGYLTNPSGDVRAVLVAADLGRGRIEFAGMLAESEFTPEQWQQVATALPSIRTRRPLVPCPYGGAWVLPTQWLTLEYVGRLNNKFDGAKVHDMREESLDALR